ncbi:DUF2993 domain-containing protein [Brevibacterium sp.]|uniref:LmeA family phospholipid-binding protein n=1 Tax=Brevibacterium sp. TaxID=1701 RepID=UPI0028117402|nr:DUF2993 domain-containing protein [Brevibacterium sp.]
MSAAHTLSYANDPEPKRRSRRTRLIVSAVIVVLTLVFGLIAADRIVDYATEQKIAKGLEPYADADVSVEGFPILNQLAAGRLGTVHVRANQAEYEGVEFADVDAHLYDVPVDSSRPVGTIDANALIPLSTIESLASEHASLPQGTSFSVVDGRLYLDGSLLGQALVVGIDPQAQSRQVTVEATSIRLGTTEIDLDSLPGFLTSAISDITIDLGFLPAGLELTEISVEDDGLRVNLRGSGVKLS